MTETCENLNIEDRPERANKPNKDKYKDLPKDGNFCLFAGYSQIAKEIGKAIDGD